MTGSSPVTPAIPKEIKPLKPSGFGGFFVPVYCWLFRRCYGVSTALFEPR